jgi:hypothetical protein
MARFNVLPTDPKFYNLYPEQMEYIYNAVNSLPELPVVKKVTELIQRRDEVMKKTESSFVKGALRKQMERHCKRMSMTEAQTNEYIKSVADKLREAELASIDKSLGIGKEANGRPNIKTKNKSNPRNKTGN